MKHLWILLAFLALISCKSKLAKYELKATDPLAAKGFQPITLVGDNHSPRFSATGRELLFVSEKRASHTSSQIYEMDLTRNMERRLTFQDGQTATPMYWPEGGFLYSSTTDEIKESPFLKIDPRFPPYEIYRSDLYGEDIERINNSPGYDSEPVYVGAAKPFLLFTSQRGGLTGLYRWDASAQKASLLSVEKDKEKRFPAASFDGKQIAWIEKDLSKSVFSIRVMSLQPQRIKTVHETPRLLQDLSWDPQKERLYYSVWLPKENRFQIEILDLANGCRQIPFHLKESFSQPVMSREKQPKMALVRHFRELRQIYITRLPIDLGPCLEESPPLKIKE